MSEAEQLMAEVCIMLRQRAFRGNPQSKHGANAAYNWECYNFVDALDNWLSRRERMRSFKK